MARRQYRHRKGATATRLRPRDTDYARLAARQAGQAATARLAVAATPRPATATATATATDSNRPTIALVGNPNVGKSVVFGYLTGRYVNVSNYPGTTVEIARGRLAGDHRRPGRHRGRHSRSTRQGPNRGRWWSHRGRSPGGS